MNNLKTYKLKVMSESFIKHYVVQAKDLTEASNIVKIDFGKTFNEIGSNIKVSLEPSDVKNHINEIIEKLDVNK